MTWLTTPHRRLSQSLGWLLIALFVFSSFAFSVEASEPLHPNREHALVGRLVSKLLTQYHYNHRSLDDAVSAEHFDFYLKFLDRNRYYFLASDIERFKEYEHQLDDALFGGNLEPAFLIFNTYKERVLERSQYVAERLKEPFDFSVNETYDLDREEAPWATSREELNELWRKRLKHEALNLKLSGKEDWESIQTTLEQRYTNYQKRVEQFNSEDVFQLFMNALSQAYDPHTSYLSPITSENFEIQMSLSFEGIGAQLTSEGDYTKVVRILPGGPADKSEQLWANDKIVGVGQGEDGEIVDVIGMKLDDVVQMIRGPKGSKVVLEIIPAQSPPGSPTKTVSLVRDKIDLVERQAKKEIIELKHEDKTYRLGVITIPSFYSDLEAQQRGETEYRSTTRDVRRLLTELKQENVDGLLIDLRQNGGGSLQEAIELSGLFIDEGPIVQVRNSFDAIKVETDPDPGALYDGPLAVLVDRYSASASEIFAAATQDYGRAVVLGGQTYGKGTVQNLLRLDRFIRSREHEFGQLKVTFAKFYRITGGTTQHRGVIPDIIYPSIYDEWEVGESAQPNALPWDQVQPAEFDPVDFVTKYLPTLRKKSSHRVQDNPEFEYIRQDIEHYRKENAEEEISLLESRRRAEREENHARELARINQRRKKKGLPPLGPDDEIPRTEKAPDAMRQESLRVLADLVNLSGSLKTAQISVEEENK